MAFLPPSLRLLSDEVFLFFQCVAPALLVRNVYGCDSPFLRGNDGVNSDYVVKGCTVRGYWNTAKRIAVQNRNRSGTKPGQKWGIFRAGREQIARRETETNAR